MKPSQGEIMYEAYLVRHKDKAWRAPTWAALGDSRRASWEAWAKAGGLCQTGQFMSSRRSV